MSASSDFSFPIERQFDIRGMSCASCVARVEKALRQLTGVIDVSVNLATEEVSLKTTPEVQVAELAAAVRNAGYEVATQTIEFQIDCMSCASCVGRVEKALLKLPGVLTASVNLATEKATVEALSRVAFSELQAAITKAGYTAHPVATQQPEATPARLPEWWPIAASTILTLPLIAPMLAQFFGVEWMLNGWAQMVLATPVQFWLGWRFYLSGWKVSVVTPTFPSALLEMPDLATDGAMTATPASFRAALPQKAYEEAGLGPEDIDLAEVYDLSTALELDWIEDLQLCPRGEAARLLREGATRIGGRIPVNPSGGLACFGEAVPAQALAQVCELVWQLRGQAGARQVEGARTGITCNQGLFGHGSAVIVAR